MARKKRRVIPKNVLAQETLRRKYAEEPWPQKLILVKSTLGKDNDIRARGQVTKLFYNLSYPYLYVDERDLDSLSDMVTQEKKPSKKPSKKVSTDSTEPTAEPKVKPRKRGRPKKSVTNTSNGVLAK